MKKNSIVLLILLTLYLSFTTNIFAVSEQFSTSIISTYTVHSDGVTTVDQRVILTNKTSEFFAKEYTLTLATEDISNINGRDSQGNIIKDIHRNSGQTRIFLVFNDQVVGKDKQLTFRIAYETNEIAKKQGYLWKILIPALPESENLESYSAILNVPNDFPKVGFFKPKPQKSSDSQYIWAGSALKTLGAIGYFGHSQYYQTKLRYTMTNQSLKLKKQELTLPPDTAYQKVTILNITPEPENILVDKDRNWLAIYNILPKSEINITADLMIETFIIPREEFKIDLTEQEKKDYLKSKQFWEVKDDAIQKLAADLETPKAIYRYVVNNLSYNYKKLEDKVGRLGATGSLRNKNNAVCTEFTDLFIAISRAAGIPAREVNGFAYTEDETLKPLSLVADVLHAWPEYYDSDLKIWRPVDPTWGNTTGGIDYFTLLDFDHVSFVNHGQSSKYPLPAGYYKQKSNEEKKQIQITFAESLAKETKHPISLELDFPNEIDALQEIEGLVILTNPNNVAKYNIEPKIISNPLKLLNKTEPIVVLPPFGKAEIKVVIAPPAQLTLRIDNEVQAIYNGKVVKTTIKIIPWFVKYIPIVISSLVIVGLLCFALYLYSKEKK